MYFGKDKILYRTIKADRLSSIILFGPPGCGKTSLARVISEKTKYKFYTVLLAVAFLGMVLTVSCDFDYSKHTEYLLHCIGSLGFSIVTGVTVFLLFLLKRNYIFTVITAVMLVGDTVLLIIFKETALIELVPIIAGLIMLTADNLRKERRAVEIK